MRGALLAELLAGLAAQRAALLLVTGEIGAGKSHACRQAANLLRRRGMRVGGIAAPRWVRAGETLGYDVVDLATGQGRPLARLHTTDAAEEPTTGEHDAQELPRVGRFLMLPGGLALARQALSRAATGARFAFVDEVGPWELAGGGLAEPLRHLLGRQLILTLVVRPALRERVARAFALPPHRCWCPSGRD